MKNGYQNWGRGEALIIGLDLGLHMAEERLSEPKHTSQMGRRDGRRTYRSKFKAVEDTPRAGPTCLELREDVGQRQDLKMGVSRTEK